MLMVAFGYCSLGMQIQRLEVQRFIMPYTAFIGVSRLLCTHSERMGRSLAMPAAVQKHGCMASAICAMCVCVLPITFVSTFSNSWPGTSADQAGRLLLANR